MDKSFRHYAGHNKPDTRVHTVWFYLYETLEQARVINGGGGGGGPNPESSSLKGVGWAEKNNGTSKVTEIFYLTEVGICQIHRIVYLRPVHFILCKFDLTRQTNNFEL